MFRESIDKENKRDKKFIFLCQGMSVVMYLLFAVLICTRYIGDKGVTGKIYSNNIIISILSIISISCFGIYYYVYKENEIFFLMLIYVIIAVEVALNFYTYNDKIISSRYLYIYYNILYFYRVILLSIMTKKENKLNKIIVNNKAISILISIALAILVFIIVINNKFLSNADINILKYVGFILMFIFTVIYIIAIGKIAIKSLENNSVLYALLTLSCTLLNVRTLVKCLYRFKYNDTVIYFSSLLIFTVYMILILGLFFVVVEKSKKEKKVYSDLLILTDIIEDDKHNEIVLFDDSRDVIYANKCARRNICDLSVPINNQYQQIEQAYFSKYLPKGKYEEIINTIKTTGKFSEDIITLNNRVYEVNVIKRKFQYMTYYFCSSFEITEKYYNEQKLIINEKKLAEITDNITELIATFDIDWNVDYINDTGLKMLGASFEEVRGHNVNEFMVDKIDKFHNFIKKESDDSVMLVHTICFKDRKSIEVESVVRRILDEDGKVNKYIIVSRSTKLKNELESIKNKYNEMQQYDKIRTEFFANLSHEVRTPINIIYSCIQLLNKEKEYGSDKIAEYYFKYEKTIRQNCLRILRLINNIIDISRYECGVIKTNFKNYDIISLIEDIIMSTVPYVKNKDIDIMFDTDTEELDVKCDCELIEKLMLNLISNSVKFTMPGGEILVDINVDDEYVNIRVKDSGIGILKEMRKLVFERFIQTDKSFNRNQEGSGIGLSLVKSIAVLHNGSVCVEDSSDKGTVFLVKLPNVRLDDDNKADDAAIKNRNLEEKINIEFSDIYDL